jgi:hypothetical protein
MPQTAAGGSRASSRKKTAMAKRSLGGEKSHPVQAARSATVVRTSPKAAKRALKQEYGPAMKSQAGRKAAVGYLAKSSGTTRGEAKGVMKQLRKGEISKGTAIKRLKGGPKAGVPAGNKKKVAKAIKRAR